MMNKIKAIMIDVDGTLTDGNYYVNESGNITKSFFTRDFWAIERAKKAGFEVYLVTGAMDGCAVTKANYVDVKIISASEDKASDVQRIILDNSDLKWEEIAFIGDAENDLDIMNKCGLTGCPSDAVEEILKDVNYTSEYVGGRGAVHDFIKYILEDIENIEWISS